MTATQALLFVGLSGLAVLASVHAWRAKEAYGLYRFCGFECLAALVAWNAPYWFRDPWSIPQILSWFILAVSLVIAVHGALLLRLAGGARQRGVEGTETLVTSGVYRYIRHPLYGSLLFGGWAVFLKRADLVALVLALAATGCWIATARAEERHNVARLGAGYTAYQGRTTMFIPFLF